MIISGKFEAQKSKPYDFVDNKGIQRVGITNVAFVRDNSDGIDPEFALRKIKLSKDYVVSAKKDDLVRWAVDITKKGDLVLLSETVK